MSNDKPKRGRPRLYDHVEIKIKIKVPITQHNPPGGFPTLDDYVESWGVRVDPAWADEERRYTVTINDKRVRP